MDVAHAVTPRWLVAALAAGSLTCGHGSARPTPVPGKPMSQPDVKLIVEPATFAMADRRGVKVGFEVTNRSASVIDPKAWDAVLLVDGQRALAWDLAVQNGAYDSRWTHLPPNETLSRLWPLAEKLFWSPGDYHLVLQHAYGQSTVDVRVTP
jgi:hypothetical protein